MGGKYHDNSPNKGQEPKEMSASDKYEIWGRWVRNTQDMFTGKLRKLGPIDRKKRLWFQGQEALVALVAFRALVRCRFA